MQTAIEEYNPITAALAGVEKYRGLVCDVTTPKGLAEAKSAHKEVAALRIALEKTRKKVKEDVVARGKLIDGEANIIFAQIAAIENPIKTQIEAEERREQEAREAAIKAEQDRLAKVEADRKAAEEAQLAAERAEIAKQRAELEAKEKARLDAEAEARRKIQEEELASKRRIEEQERAARAVVDAANRQAQAVRDAEDARQQAERDRLAAIQRAADEKRRQAEAEAAAKAKIEQDRKDAEERERRRVVMEKADARTALELWRNRYGHMAEYAGVVAAIDECLAPA